MPPTTTTTTTIEPSVPPSIEELVPTLDRWQNATWQALNRHDNPGASALGVGRTPVTARLDDARWIDAVLATFRSLGPRVYDSPPTGELAMSGAYSYSREAWRNEAGYVDAYLAPPEVQDERARRDVVAILDAFAGDASMLPVYWYHAPAIADAKLLETVPDPTGPIFLSVGAYQAEWIGRFRTIWDAVRDSDLEIAELFVDATPLRPTTPPTIVVDELPTSVPAVPEPEPVTEPDLVVEPEPVNDPEPVAAADPVTAPDEAVAPEPEPGVDPAVVAEPVAAADSTITPEPAGALASAPLDDTEIAAASEPVADVDPVAAPDQANSPKPEPEPAAAADPAPVAAAEHPADAESQVEVEGSEGGSAVAPADVDPADVDPVDVDPADVDPVVVDPADVAPVDVDPVDVDPVVVDADGDDGDEVPEASVSQNTLDWAWRSLPPAPREHGAGSLRAITFPVLGPVRYSDGWGDPRAGGARRHEGTDIIGVRMQPLLAVVDGTLSRVDAGHRGIAGGAISIRDADGWRYNYFHANNDTPGTDDGNSPDEFRLAPGLSQGDAVVAGQIIGYMGDSGNAEGSVPHLHFEMRDPSGAARPSYWSLRNAEASQACTVGIGPWSFVEEPGDEVAAETTELPEPAGLPEPAELVETAESAEASSGAASENAGADLVVRTKVIPLFGEGWWSIDSDGRVVATGVAALIMPSSDLRCDAGPADLYGADAGGWRADPFVDVDQADTDQAVVAEEPESGDDVPVSEPVDPASPEPATTEPATTEPATTEPATTEPLTSADVARRARTFAADGLAVDPEATDVEPDDPGADGTDDGVDDRPPPTRGPGSVVFVEPGSGESVVVVAPSPVTEP